MQRWWSRSEFLFPPPSFVHDEGFAGFLSDLRFRYNFLNTPQAYAAVLAEYVRSAAVENICYAELQLNLALIQTWSLDLVAVLDEMNAAVAAANDAPTVRYILDLPWQFSASALVDAMGERPSLRSKGVVGFSMGGDERLANPADVTRAIGPLREMGLKFMCHLGEITDTEAATEAAIALRPDRIGHGVALAEWLSSLGPDAPPVDVCLSSNLLTGAVPCLEAHPLPRWVDAAVPFSLSTDDPAVFDTDLAREYRLAAELCPRVSEQPFQKHWMRAAFDPGALERALFQG